MKSLWFVAALSTATPAFAAEQFDLICSGTVRHHPSRGQAQDIRHRFSFDLAAGRYCLTSWTSDGQSYNEECKNVLSIGGVTPDRITLIEGQPGTIYYIDRQSGGYTHFERSPFSDERGSCEVADYRQLTAPRF